MSLNPKFAGLAVAVDASVRMTIMHPFTKQPLRVVPVAPEGGEPPPAEDCYIDVMSGSSKVAREHDRAVLDRNIRTRSISAGDVLEADLTEKLAKLSTGWKLANLDGSPLDVPWSPQAARDLFAIPELGWLREQVFAFVNDLGNWRTAASKN